MKNVLEPITKAIEDISEGLTKTMTETSEEGYKAKSELNEKFLDTKINRCTLAFFCCLLDLKSLTPNKLANLN